MRRSRHCPLAPGTGQAQDMRGVHRDTRSYLQRTSGATGTLVSKGDVQKLPPCPAAKADHGLPRRQHCHADLEFASRAGPRCNRRQACTARSNTIKMSSQPRAMARSKRAGNRNRFGHSSACIGSGWIWKLPSAVAYGVWSLTAGGGWPAAGT